MGQRSCYLLDRQGSFQFWNSAWDSKVNYSLFFTNFYILDKILTIFIKGKNSVNYFFLIKNPEINDLLEEKNLVFNESFSLFNNFFQQKKILKKFFYLFGKTLFFKYQGWHIICISTYRPLNKKNVVADKLNLNALVSLFEKKKQMLDFF